MPDATKSFTILESTDSTNKYAMQLIHSNLAVDGAAYFAHRQTDGKGRRGKSWQSNAGENIIISITCKANFINVHNQFKISAAVALAGAELLRNFVDENIKIKWPNDLVWNDRKAGGILIENVINGNDWQWAVIGVGINLNQTLFLEEYNLTPVSVKQITGKESDVLASAKMLHQLILKNLKELKEDGFENIYRQYNNFLFKKDEKVKLRKNNIVFETEIKGVSKNGELLTKDAIDRSFVFDEVQWVLS